MLSACHPRDFLPEQSVQNLAQSISTGPVTCRNNVGSCSQETQWQTLCWILFPTNTVANSLLVSPRARGDLWERGRPVGPALTAYSTKSELLIHRNKCQSCYELGWSFSQSLAILKCIWKMPWLQEGLTLMEEGLPISPLAPATLEHGFSQGRWRVLHDEHGWCSFFFLKLCWTQDACLHLLPILPTTAFGQTLFGWKRQEPRSCCWATGNKRSESFQIDPALAWSWDGSESHQETVAEVTQERKQDD